MHVAVSVILKDGTTHRHVCDHPPGSWGHPIDRHMHEAKLRSCLGVRFSERNVDRVLELLGAFEQLDADDMQDLMALLRR